VELFRDGLSPEQAGRLIALLARELAELSAPGAEVIARIAQAKATLAHQAPHLPTETVQTQRDRLRRHHQRALEAMTFVVDENRGGGPNHRYERACLVLIGLTDSAELLLPKVRPIPCEPSASDWAKWRRLSDAEIATCHSEHSRGSKTEGAELCRRCFDWSETGHNGWKAQRAPTCGIKESESRAIAEARRRIRELTEEVVGDRALLKLLQTLGRPQSVDRDEIARYKAARLTPPKHLSERERIRACSGLLRRLGLWPDVRARANSADVDAKAIEQLRKMLPAAWRSRQEEFGVVVRTGQRRSSKKPDRKAASRQPPTSVRARARAK
jgi:hypothetical protein